jgi:hypothetical protein
VGTDQEGEESKNGCIRNKTFTLLLFLNKCFILQADVVPTIGGGAQVIFSDVETLKQQSPSTVSSRKRGSSTCELKDIEATSTVFTEGHKRARH